MGAVRAKRGVAAVAAVSVALAALTAGRAGAGHVIAGRRARSEGRTLQPGSKAPFASLGEIVFASPSLAYSLVQDGSATYLASSSDGGSRWLLAAKPFATAAVPPSALGVASSGALYAYGARGAGSILWVSTDAGATWSEHTFPGSVEDVTGSGPELWVLVDGAEAPPSAAQHGPLPPAPGWLYVSDATGTSFARRSVLPGEVGPYVLLVQPSAQVAYALAPGENNPNPGRYGGLVRTTSAGASWGVVDQPCDEDASPRFGDSAVLAASGPFGLWMACSADLKLITGIITEVLRSSDGGWHWHLVAASSLWVAKRPSFPTLGMIPPASQPETAVVDRASAALVLSGRDALFATSDGGRSWADPLPKAIAAQDPVAVVEVASSLLVRTTRALWRKSSSSWVRVDA